MAGPSHGWRTNQPWTPRGRRKWNELADSGTAGRRHPAPPYPSGTVSCQAGTATGSPSASTRGARAAWAGGSPWTR